MDGIAAAGRRGQRRPVQIDASAADGGLKLVDAMHQDRAGAGADVDDTVPRTVDRVDARMKAGAVGLEHSRRGGGRGFPENGDVAAVCRDGAAAEIDTRAIAAGSGRVAIADRQNRCAAVRRPTGRAAAAADPEAAAMGGDRDVGLDLDIAAVGGVGIGP